MKLFIFLNFTRAQFTCVILCLPVPWTPFTNMAKKEKIHFSRKWFHPFEWNKRILLCPYLLVRISILTVAVCNVCCSTISSDLLLYLLNIHDAIALRNITRLENPIYISICKNNATRLCSKICILPKNL